MSAAATTAKTGPNSAERQGRLPGVGLLSAATLGSGILAYVFLVLAARALTPEAYGQVGVLWGSLYLAVVVLFRPLEQTTTRTIADRLTRHSEVRTVLRSVAGIYLAVISVGSVVAAFAWAPVRDTLFLGSNFLTAMLFAGTAIYGLEYLLRGVMAGGRWFRGYALCLMADAVARLAIGLPLIVVGSKSVAAAAIAAAAVGGFMVPLWVGRRWLHGLARPGTGDRFDLGAALTFAAPVSIIAAADQVLVNGGPLLVMLGGGPGASKAAGLVFAATMLVRIPVYMFQGVAASLLPNLTRLQALEDTALFRATLRRAAVILVCTAIAITAFAAAIGPQAMGMMYGSGFSAGRDSLALLGAGVGCYLAAATLSQALLALDRGRLAALAWTSSALLFLAIYAVLPGGQLQRIAAAFLVATAACTLLLTLSLARRVRRRTKTQTLSGMIAPPAGVEA